MTPETRAALRRLRARLDWRDVAFIQVDGRPATIAEIKEERARVDWLLTPLGGSR